MTDEAPSLCCPHCQEDVSYQTAVGPGSKPPSAGAYLICSECRKPSRFVILDGRLRLEPSTVAALLRVKNGRPPSKEEVEFAEYKLMQAGLLDIIARVCEAEIKTKGHLPIVALPRLEMPIFISLEAAIPAAAKNDFTRRLLEETARAVPGATFLMVYGLLGELHPFALVQVEGTFDMTAVPPNVQVAIVSGLPAKA